VQTLTIQEVIGDGLLLQFERVGNGILEAYGSFVIADRVSDSWKINRQYSVRVNTTNFRDGRPLDHKREGTGCLAVSAWSRDLVIGALVLAIGAAALSGILCTRIRANT
jgi:hypothetical protein